MRASGPRVLDGVGAPSRQCLALSINEVDAGNASRRLTRVASAPVPRGELLAAVARGGRGRSPLISRLGGVSQSRSAAPVEEKRAVGKDGRHPHCCCKTAGCSSCRGVPRSLIARSSGTCAANSLTQASAPRFRRIPEHATPRSIEADNWRPSPVAASPRHRSRNRTPRGPHPVAR
jgi:hypothetical protein